MIPPAPRPMGNCTAFALGWINLTTLLLRPFASLGSCCSSRLGDPKGDILRIGSAIGFTLAGQHSSSSPGTERETDQKRTIPGDGRSIVGADARKEE